LDLVVQPISFLMKINVGTVEFTDAEYREGTLQYAIYWCKGIDYIDRDFVFFTLRQMVPLIPELVLVPEAAVYQEELTQLQAVLEDNAEYCDNLIIDTVVATNEGDNAEYTILTFDTASAALTNDDARVCFNLLTFALAYAPEVCYIERRLPFETANLDATWVTQSSVPDDVPFFNAGITGVDQVVSVSDTGLDLQSCYFADQSGTMSFGTGYDMSKRKVIQYVDYVNAGEDRDGHGTHVAGTIAGQRSDDGRTATDGFVDGIAYNAQIAFFDIGKDDPSASLLVPGASTLLNPGYNAGARVHSASWGSSSDFYTNMDRDFDKYLHRNKDFLVIIAAGNEGPVTGTVRSPSHSKNVLTVGATQNEGRLDRLASFSSIGPAMDGRIKPDLVAPGQHILSVGSRDGPSCDPPSESGLPGDGGRVKADDIGILSLQGTSMATPVVSGSAALVRQYFAEGFHGDGSKGSADPMEPSGAMMKAIMINGARPLSGYALNQVDSKQGFGRLSLIDSLPLAGSNELVASFLDYQVVEQGKVNVYNGYDISANETCSDAEFSVTLVWADPAGYVGCLKCLYNDLDLFVLQTKADGSQTGHYPNGKTDKDDKNNVERVRFLANPGDSFEVSVRGTLLEDSSQTYALSILSGCGDHRGVENYGTSGAYMGTSAVSMIGMALALIGSFLMMM